MSERENGAVTDGSQGGLARRNFIKGIIAGGAVAASASYLFRERIWAAPSAGSVERLVTLSVNGQLRRVDVLKQESLAMTLRYKLGLTGTKLGCDRAECGACTVLIDDVPRYSCSVLTHTVRQSKVTTIEGLAGPNGQLHPVQQAVVDEQGFQCAFCKTNPKPTRTELAHGISGNLCRCCDYNKILRSMLRAADSMEHV